MTLNTAVFAFVPAILIVLSTLGYGGDAGDGVIGFKESSVGASEFPAVGLDESKPAVMVHYTVDTKEPLMQLSAAREDAAFSKACDLDVKQNWIKLTNTDLVTQTPVPYCKQGKAGFIAWSDKQELYKSIQSIIAKLSDTRFSAAALYGALKFPATITANAEKHRVHYKTYPMASADVMYLLLKEMTADLFPHDEFNRILHFKGHAVASDKHDLNIVLTGLDEQTIAKKTKEQNVQLDAAPFPKPDEQLGIYGLGIYGLGIYGLGIYGLGIYGLSAESYFGINAAQFRAVINALSDDEGQEIAFVTIEACTADMRKHLPMRLYTHANPIATRGIYMPSGFLAYNNIDWREFWSKPEAAQTTGGMYQRIKDASSRMINYHPIYANESK